MSVDISVSITEDVVDIISTPTVNIVNVTNSASIDPGLYDLSEFTNTSPNPFVRTSGLSSYVPTSRTITINGLTQDLSINRSWTIPATTWGTITGTLSAQTDLQTALNAKQNTLSLTTTGSSGASTLVGSTLNVPNYTLSGLGGVPTSRTLTINGVTQDLSANRTFTISTGITIGSTAIASGTVGRILFEGAGNVVQESSSLFWDEAATRFQVGTTATSPVGSPLIFMGKDQNAETNFQISNATNGTGAAVGFRILSSNNRASYLYEFAQSFSSITEYASHLVLEPNAAGVKHGFIISLPETTLGSDFMIYTGGRNASNRRLTLFNGTGNLAIGTTTDAGFRLDVNGTARVQGVASVIHNSDNYTFGFTLRNNSSLNSALTGINLNNQGTSVGQFVYCASNYIDTPLQNTVLFSSVGLQKLAFVANASNTSTGGSDVYFKTRASNTNGLILFGNTQNVGINTTTDAGFRLDVNGTARFNGNLTFQTTSWILDNSNAIMHRGGFNVESIAFNLSRMVFTDNNGFVFNGNNSAATLTASSIVDIQSTTKGFLPPRQTQAQRTAIASPAVGLIVYQTDLVEGLYIYKSTGWQFIA